MKRSANIFGKRGERLVREADALESSKTDLQSKTVNIATEVTQVSSQNEHLSSQINEIKLQINSQRTHVEQFQKELGDLNQKLENSKNRLMQLIADEAKYKNIYQNASTNKENVQRRLKRVDEQVAMADKKVESIEKENDEANQELRAINEEIKELQTQIDALKNSLEEESKHLGESVKRAHTLELERNKVRSQLSTLKKMADNYEWYRDGGQSRDACGAQCCSSKRFHFVGKSASDCPTPFPVTRDSRIDGRHPRSGAGFCRRIGGRAW